MKKKEEILKSAGRMGGATFISRILGLVREQVFAIFFGAGNAMDAYLIAFRIPNLLRDLFAEGAMSAALVPTFVSVREKEGDRRAWRVAGLTFRLLTLVTVLITLVGIFFAEELVMLYASAFREIPGKFQLTVTLTQTIYPYFVFVALAAAFMAVLNACGIFFLPALASAMFNLTSILFGLLLSFLVPRYGRHPIEGMALGVVIGGIFQAFFQLPALYRAGYRWPKKKENERVWYREPAVRRIMLLMIPGTVGLAATQINILVNSLLATREGVGAVSWLGYSFRLMQFPIGIFGVSLAVATLPVVSKLWAQRKTQEVSDTIFSSLKRTFAVNFPASAGLAFLSVPIMQLIFEYGSFSAEDTAAAALALSAYALGLGFYSAIKVLVPVFYMMKRTQIAVVSSIFSVIANLGLNLLLVGPFSYWGLALGTSITAFLNFLLLIIFLNLDLKRIGVQFPIAGLIRALFTHAVLALFMGWICYEIAQTFRPGAFFGGSIILSRVIDVLFLVGVGVSFVFFVAKAFKITETVEIFEFFSRKVFRK